MALFRRKNYFRLSFEMLNGDGRLLLVIFFQRRKKPVKEPSGRINWNLSWNGIQLKSSCSWWLSGRFNFLPNKTFLWKQRISEATNDASCESWLQTEPMRPGPPTRKSASWWLESGQKSHSSLFPLFLAKTPLFALFLIRKCWHFRIAKIFLDKNSRIFVPRVLP